MPQKEKIFTREFVALNTIIFLVFCNVAVFFQFEIYLDRELHLPGKQLGFLIGVFAFTALVVRPFISPFLHTHNARKWLFRSTIGVIVSLLLYYPATGFWSLTLVRILHGVWYVVLATAALAQLMVFIPEGRSGQAFGLITVITLLPYAVMPPLLEPLIRLGGGFLPVLYLTAFLMILIFPLLAVIRGAGRKGEEKVPPKFSSRELLENLRSKPIFSLLAVSLLVYTAFAPVFYFLKGFALKIGITNPGWFFTLSTFMEIAVRLFGGSRLDKGSKRRTLTVSLIGLAAAYPFLAVSSGPVLFFGLGLVFGFFWGLAMPLLNSMIFDHSPPRFRAMNTNLAMVMFQGGFFLGPLLGGWILNGGDYRTLYYTCGAMMVAALGFIPLITKKEQ
jgi:predicted MFS family arabinose efflux permease